MLDKYIPLDKSWIIRMGVLDILNGRNEMLDFLNTQPSLNDDLLALQRVCRSWPKDEPLDVGESGTLYRFLKFINWKLRLNKQFITSGTLAERDITDDPSITNLSQAELLKLDNETSQWASAAALAGDTERISNPPFKLTATYEAIDHWNNARTKGESWQPRYDQTILKQAEAFIQILQTGSADFTPEQAEDFCFALTFGYISADEGAKQWPSLVGHESNRIKEMPAALEAAKNGAQVASKDHRIVQAIAMRGIANNTEVNITYPDAVNKSWPQFWKFISWLQTPHK